MARFHAEQVKRRCCFSCDDVFTDWLKFEQPSRSWTPTRITLQLTQCVAASRAHVSSSEQPDAAIRYGCIDRIPSRLLVDTERCLW